MRTAAKEDVLFRILLVSMSFLFVPMSASAENSPVHECPEVWQPFLENPKEEQYNEAIRLVSLVSETDCWPKLVPSPDEFEPIEHLIRQDNRYAIKLVLSTRRYQDGANLEDFYYMLAIAAEQSPAVFLEEIRNHGGNLEAILAMPSSMDGLDDHNIRIRQLESRIDKFAGVQEPSLRRLKYRAKELLINLRNEVYKSSSYAD